MGFRELIASIVGKGADPKADEPGAIDKIKAEVAAQAARQAVSAAASQVSAAADGALDDIEKALLGKVGASDEILAKEGEVDPLDKIRKQYGTGPTPQEKAAERKASVAEREAKARAELAELKKKMGKS